MYSIHFFLPLPQKEETVSHPVSEWNIGRVAQNQCSISATTSWTGIYRKFDPVPNDKFLHSISHMKEEAGVCFHMGARNQVTRNNS